MATSGSGWVNGHWKAGYYNKAKNRRKKYEVREPLPL